jgi:3-hydroxybutyryl-CoA dehydrogenase
VLDRPERFAGLHFFNPAPLMALVEIISGLATRADVAGSLVDLMSLWGKSPVHARSTPGFIVNRVARPYYGEALRLVQEHTADHATIDAILRDAAGFRMGPFALMDLIGNDVNFAVTATMHRAWFGDPRYQPSVIQQELVDAGRLGRKSGIGFFDYRLNGVLPEPICHTPNMPAPLRVAIGDNVDPALAAMILTAGIALEELEDMPDAITWDGLHLCMTDGRTATERARDEGCDNLVLFDLVTDWSTVTAVALTNADQSFSDAIDKAAALFASLGKMVYIIADRPGMVVARTIAMLANEAADVVLHGVATATDVDRAMQLGANHPFGPLEIADRLGATWITRLLDNLATAYGEDRYRASSLLRRLSASERRFHGGTA